MVSKSGYQLYSEDGEYWTFEYAGTEVYKNKEYFKYSLANAAYILAPTRKITKVTSPFDDYYVGSEGVMSPLFYTGFDSLYGFTSIPENKVVMKPRTDIGTDNKDKDYVDLGLTSGTLWATCNVGATSETDYGSYFQWGDTVDKRDADCSWSSYKYGDGSNFSKYNTGLNGYGGTIDNKLTLDLEDDAARVHMGGDWRMPSLALMEELVYETNNMSATINGVNGWKFTSKTDPSKYIFIPAAGERLDSSFNHQGSYGFVWSSSLNTAWSDLTWTLRFGSGSISADTYDSRYFGYVVRGVL